MNMERSILKPWGYSIVPVTLMIVLLLGSLVNFGDAKKKSSNPKSSKVEPTTFYTAENELKIPSENQADFDEFKEVATKLAKQKFMKSNLWLVKVFRNANYDAQAAITAYKDTLKFRKENQIDEALEEDFSHFHKGYPFLEEGLIDKENRPLAMAYGGKFDIATAIQNNQLQDLKRYCWNMWDKMTMLAFSKKKEDVSRFFFLSDLEGFNPMTAGLCPGCSTFWTDVFGLGDKHWPSTIYKCFFINAGSFEAVIKLIKNVLSPESQSNLHIYGDIKEWKTELLTYVDEDQVPKGVKMTARKKEGGLTISFPLS